MLKKFYPNTIYTDIIYHNNCDLLVDARNMPFADKSIGVFFLHNVFHHIPDVEEFLNEAKRCLKKNGIIYIIDPHNSFFSQLIYRYFHHENFNTSAEWKFESKDLQTDSNQALSWIVFERDLKIFNKKFSELQVIKKSSFSFLSYILSGGFNYSFNVPHFIIKLIYKLESFFHIFMKKFTGLFCEVLIKKL